jgi:hypothetical protein
MASVLARLAVRACSSSAGPAARSLLQAQQPVSGVFGATTTGGLAAAAFAPSFGVRAFANTRAVAAEAKEAAKAATASTGGSAGAAGVSWACFFGQVLLLQAGACFGRCLCSLHEAVGRKLG